jgi:hypothetical protein
MAKIAVYVTRLISGQFGCRKTGKYVMHSNISDLAMDLGSFDFVRDSQNWP